MPTWFGTLGQQVAGQAATGAVAMGLQRLGANYDTRVQEERARGLMGIQMEGEKEMMDYQQKKQMDMWLNTNYGAQVNQMNKAGINPALLYGQGGGGGQTIGAGIPSVGGASAQSPDTAKAATGMGIMNSAQLAILEAQKRNIDADTANKEAENPNIPKTGENIVADTQLKIANTGNTNVDTALKIAQTKTVELANQITSASKNDQIAMWAEQVDKIVNETRNLAANAKVNEDTINDRINQIKAQAIGAVIDNVLKESQTKLTNEETKKVKQDILNSIQQLKLTEGGQRIEMRKAEIQRLLGNRGLDIAQQAVIMSAIEKVTGVIGNATK